MKAITSLIAGTALLVSSAVVNSATITTISEGGYTLVTSILGLPIGGSSYDVVFHRDKSFAQLWDVAYFHGGTPYDHPPNELSGEPTFWYTVTTLAEINEAGLAVQNELANYSGVYTDIDNFGNPASGFIVPNGGNNIQNVITYWGTTDIHILSPADGKPYASFSPAASLSAVPLPAAVWLFGSGLIGLISVTRRKRMA